MTKRPFIPLALAALLWLPGAPATSAGPGSPDPTARIQADEGSVCPVCGMFVARHPEWLAQVVWPDGSEAFFDGPKDLFKYLLAPARYAGDRADLDPDAVRVTSYYDGTALSAREAFYVVGGDVLGPMGEELVPHRTREDAEEFLTDHHGDRIVRFDDITPELVNGLD